MAIRKIYIWRKLGSLMDDESNDVPQLRLVKPQKYLATYAAIRNGHVLEDRYCVEFLATTDVQAVIFSDRENGLARSKLSSNSQSSYFGCEFALLRLRNNTNRRYIDVSEVQDLINTRERKKKGLELSV